MDMLDSIASRLFVDAARHSAIAGNIANAQTPGYIAKDVVSSKFGAALSLAMSNHRHLSGGGVREGVNVVERKNSADMASMDGNTVDLDYERGQMASNALDMETQMRFATHYLRQRQISAG